MTPILTLFLAVVTSLALAPPAPISQEQPQIRVEISGIRSAKGKVVCALWNSPEGFPKKSEKAIGHSTAPITGSTAKCVFAGIAAGTYAVSVFHDENDNGKLETNFVGMPKEGVGASNNASGHFGPPKFEAAAFKYSGGELALKITLRYL